MSEVGGGMEQGRNVGLMVAVPIFLLINAVFAYVGGRMMSKLEKKSSEDVLTAHYLGGRSFGPILSLGTMFASAFSGFTVIGLPNSSYSDGWMAFIWVISSQLITTFYGGVAPRLRKASIVRNHQSPSDFITDMFQSQLLRYTVIISQCVSQFVWMTSNVLSIKMAFNGAFNLPADSPWMAVGVVALIVVSEWVGGLSAVALTDTVQGTIMIFGSIAVAGVIKFRYGGWTSLDPETFYRPEFYQTPSRQQQWYWWQIALLSGSMVFYPIIIQRIYAARDMKSIKTAGYALFLGPWLAMLPAVFVGTMGIQIVGDTCQSSSNPAECMNPSSPFTTILSILMSLGGFPQVSAIVFYCSALAAIMSTVDSVLISMSQIVTSDMMAKMMTTTDDKEEDLRSQDPFPDRPQWDKPKVQRFGEHSLSPELLDAMMRGVEEPIRDYKYIFLVILAFTITTPIVAELRPSIVDGVFVELPPVVRGVPAWFFKAMIISFVINFVNIPVLISMPEAFPYSEEELLRSGIDADVVELEPEEKGGRTGYDEPNQKAIIRRQSIREETKRIKKANEDAKRAFEEARANDLSATEAGMLLTLLVKDPSKRDVAQFPEDDKKLNDGEGDDDVDDFEESPAVKAA